jgi:hypothetical protein
MNVDEPFFCIIEQQSHTLVERSWKITIKMELLLKSHKINAKTSHFPACVSIDVSILLRLFARWPGGETRMTALPLAMLTTISHSVLDNSKESHAQKFFSSEPLHVNTPARTENARKFQKLLFLITWRSQQAVSQAAGCS